jgi:thymidine kinase
VVGIDEAQFFDDEIVKILMILLIKEVESLQGLEHGF